MHTLEEIKISISYDSTVGTTTAESFAIQTLNAIGNNTGLTVEGDKVFFNESKTIGMRLYANGSNFYYTSFFNFNGSTYIICSENSINSISTSSIVTLRIHRSTNEKVTVIGIGTDAYPHYTIYAENNSGVGSVMRYGNDSGYGAYLYYGTDSLSARACVYTARPAENCSRYSCTKMPDVYNNGVFNELYYVTSVFSVSTTYYATSDQLVQFNDSVYRFVPTCDSSTNSFKFGGFAFPVSDPA